MDSLLTIASKLGNLALAVQEHDPPVGPKDRPYCGAAISNEVSCVEAARIMDAAFQIIRAWPERVDGLFSSLANRNPEPSDDHPVRSIFSTRAGYRLLGRIKSVSGETISVLDDALQDWLMRKRGIYTDARQRPKVGAAGDIAIDVADALRRLEGRSGHPNSIRTWVAAGAIKMIGRYVSLRSVEDTVEAIKRLQSSAFEDAMGIEDWSTRFLYHRNYKRSDAIKDLLSEKIRVRQLKADGRSGLASIEISSEDFLRCTREAAALAKSEVRSVLRRAERARRMDAFCRPGQLHALLAARWPEHSVFDVTKEARVRCRTDVRRYYGRTMRQKLYSIVDALDLMEERSQTAS